MRTKFPENEVTQFNYSASGLLSSQLMPNGVVTTYGYDGQDRMNSVIHQSSLGLVLTAESYQYDAGDNLTAKTVDGITTSYVYDPIDQLLSETSPGITTAYAYDGIGNRRTKTVNGAVETYVYNLNNTGDQLISRTGPQGTTSYQYDAAGRTTQITSPIGSVMSLAYDYEDRVSSYTDYVGTSSYAYNGADARVAKTSPSGNRTYRRDGAGATDSVLSDGVATMVPGVSEHRGSATSFLHQDYLGTTKRITDANQNVTSSMSFDAFGVATSRTGSTNTQNGFAGGWEYQEDPESGLKLLGHRFYDAASGRFITRDPIGQGLNWYCYCENNPNQFVDPQGLEIIPAGFKQLRMGQRAKDATTDKGYPKRHPGRGSSYQSPTTGRIKPGQPLYTDCGTFVKEAVGDADPDYPVSGTTVQYNYLNKSSKWDKVKPGDKPRVGDVAIRPGHKGRIKNVPGHTMIFGNGTGKEKYGGIWYDANLGDHGPMKEGTGIPRGMQIWRLK